MASREVALQAAKKAQAARAARQAEEVAASAQAKAPAAVLVDTSDAGRAGMLWEFMVSPGHEVLDLPMATGGSLQVTAHEASEAEPPPGSALGSWLEWRVLRFSPEHESMGFGRFLQSVAKVCVKPDGSLQLQASVLALAYSRSAVAVTLAALVAMGVPVVGRLRVLVIGLGGGSIPSFLVKALPQCEVDVAELEPAVLDTACSAMGFCEGPRLRAVLEDGAAFALRMAGAGACYDAVFVDAMDWQGNVPEPLLQGVTQALSRGLLRASGGLVLVNLSARFGQPARPAAVLAAWAAAVHRAGVSFSVRSGAGPEANWIAVHGFGGKIGLPAEVPALRAMLEAAGCEVSRVLGCAFDVAELATQSLRVW